MISGAIVQITDSIGLTEREPIVQQQSQPTVIYYCQTPQIPMQPFVQQPIQTQQIPMAFKNENSVFSSPIPVVSDKSEFNI